MWTKNIFILAIARELRTYTKNEDRGSLLFFMAFIYLKQYLLLDIIVASYDKFVVKIWVTKRGLQKASKVPILDVFVILAVFLSHSRSEWSIHFFDFSTLRTQKSESLIFRFNMFPLFKIKF